MLRLVRPESPQFSVSPALRNMVDCLADVPYAQDFGFGKADRTVPACEAHHLVDHPEVEQGLAEGRAILLCVPASQELYRARQFATELFAAKPGADVQVLVGRSAVTCSAACVPQAVAVDLAILTHPRSIRAS